MRCVAEAGRLFLADLITEQQMRKNAVLPAICGLAVAVAGTAQAQDTDAAPTQGTVELWAGFTEDPYTVRVVSGGDLDVYDLLEARYYAIEEREGFDWDSEDEREYGLDWCSGYIRSAPDVVLIYSATEVPLIISAQSEDDAVLLVHGPDGRFYCSDDDGEGDLNPSITLARPITGQYEIWVGSYDEEDVLPAVLQFSESETL